MTDPDGPAPEAHARLCAPPHEAPSSTRPTFTLAEAARVTGTSRRTLGRLLDAGELPGAARDASGAWSIPVDALLAAGLTVHAPAPPEAPQAAPSPFPPPSTPPIATAPDPAELNRLRDEVADWRRRAEVAEAVAAERSANLVDVREALATTRMMLNAGPQPAASTEAPRRRRWRRKDETA